MNEKEQKQPEIKDGKLIIGNSELNLEGLEILSEDYPHNFGATYKRYLHLSQ